MALMYCKKCGRLIQGNYDNNDNSLYYCDCCNSITHKVPIGFLISESVPIIKSDLKQQFIDEYIKTSPEFDQYLFEHRDEILAKQSAEFNAKIEHGKAILEGRDKGNKFGIECPYCHATDVKKISGFSKAVEVGLLGILAMDRMGKQWHCNHCNSDF